MNRWTAQQRAFAVNAFYLNSSSFVVAKCVFRAHFGINCNHPVPSGHAIKLRVKNFEQSGTTIKKKKVEENEIFELKRILNG